MSRKTLLKGQDAPVNRELLKDFALEDVHHYLVNRHSFTVFVSGESLAFSDGGVEPGVEFRMADRFERNLHLLSAINPQRPILVILASNGGFVSEGLQMLGALLTCPNPVTVLGVKDCVSMTSIIPLAADKFVIRPPARYMFHRGQTNLQGTDTEVAAQDIERRKDQELTLRLYVDRLRQQGAHTRSSVTRLREMVTRLLDTRGDVWYSAAEAARVGFTDDVFDGNYKILRTTKVNTERRKRLMDVLTREINVEVNVK